MVTPLLDEQFAGESVRILHGLGVVLGNEEGGGDPGVTER